MTIDLDSVNIPMINKQDGEINSIYMLKIKVGAESNCIFVGAPNRIIDPLHQRMQSNIDSANDKVYLEFYDVLNESAFDHKQQQSMTNLKLLSLHIFDVKDFAFDKQGICKGHRVLLPVQTSGNIASFTFNSQFVASVEELKMPIEVNEPYLLFVKMISSVK